MSFPGGGIQWAVRSSGEGIWLDTNFGDHFRDVVVGTLGGDQTLLMPPPMPGTVG